MAKPKGSKRTHDKLVDEIAAHTHIRRDVVESVIEGFVDVMAERILNEGKFTITNVLTVSTKMAKNYFKPESHLQLRVRFSSKFKALFSALQDSKIEDADRNNWRNLLKDQPNSKSSEQPMKLNDFLQADDEEY